MDILLLALLVVVFLGLPVLQMRKQSKQVGVIKDFQSKLAPGMVVQLTSGLHGRLTSIGETTVDVEIAEGVVTTWERAAVLKLVDSVEAGSTEADHLTGGGIPDDLSSLEDSDFDRDNDDDTDGTDRK
ncbi:preprotein translocase subunit YajC [Corynebacterium sp.]|jgi:preprotein translocase subunit YajC|uniref:preprotein translocase subunit YajC n=1 Tax=Corynebacterium sp. TaxID=1720 RepID=UPI0025C4FD4C|nr:preprotein translocase subunit YajC [Corynebacterium sp.]